MPCLTLGVIVVANTSLNVGIHTLVKDLHAGSSALQWIVLPDPGVRSHTRIGAAGHEGGSVGIGQLPSAA